MINNPNKEEGFYTQGSKELVNALIPYLLASGIQKEREELDPVEFEPDLIDLLKSNRRKPVSEQLREKEFTQTETKLAEIWKKAVPLSENEFKSLHQESKFFDYTPVCATFELYFLRQHVNEVFGLDINEFFDVTILAEQAALIDRLLNLKDERDLKDAPAQPTD